MARWRSRRALAAATAAILALAAALAVVTRAPPAPVHFFIEPVLQDGLIRPEGRLLAGPDGPEIPEWRFEQTGTIAGPKWTFSRAPTLVRRLRETFGLPVETDSFWAVCVPRAPHGIRDRTEWVRIEIELPDDDFPPAADLAGLWATHDPRSRSATQWDFELRRDGTYAIEGQSHTHGLWGARDDIVVFKGTFGGNDAYLWSAIVAPDRKSFGGGHDGRTWTRKP